MKKSIIFCLCVTIIALFASCNRDPDGVYNPAKKIHKIYEVNDVYGTYVSQVWNWNGNQLSSINRYDHRGDLYSTNIFEYDGDRLMKFSDEGMYIKFHYKDDKVDYIEESVNGEDQPCMVYSFQYDGNKLNQLEIKYIPGVFGIKKTLVNPLRFILPDVCTPVENMIAKHVDESKGEQTITLTFTWTGRNITSVKTDMVWETGWASEVTKCTFDNKHNPIKGFFGNILYSSGRNILYCNQNNLLSATTTSFGTPFSTTTYDYEYEDNYPVKITKTTTYQDPYEGVIPDVVTYIYEY